MPTGLCAEMLGHLPPPLRAATHKEETGPKARSGTEFIPHRSPLNAYCPHPGTMRCHIQPDFKAPYTCLTFLPPPRPVRGYGGGHPWVQTTPGLHGDALSTAPRSERLASLQRNRPRTRPTKSSWARDPANLPRSDGPKATVSWLGLGSSHYALVPSC